MCRRRVSVQRHYRVRDRELTVGTRRSHDSEEMAMPAYAVARVRTANVTHPKVAEYLRRIQSILDPFSGRFLVHGGGRMEQLEGDWS
jgi:hypothetical protein